MCPLRTSSDAPRPSPRATGPSKTCFAQELKRSIQYLTTNNREISIYRQLDEYSSRARWNPGLRNFFRVAIAHARSLAALVRVRFHLEDLVLRLVGGLGLDGRLRLGGGLALDAGLVSRGLRRRPASRDARTSRASRRCVPVGRLLHRVRCGRRHGAHVVSSVGEFRMLGHDRLCRAIGRALARLRCGLLLRRRPWRVRRVSLGSHPSSRERLSAASML